MERVEILLTHKSHVLFFLSLLDTRSIGTKRPLFDVQEKERERDIRGRSCLWDHCEMMANFCVPIIWSSEYNITK